MASKKSTAPSGLKITRSGSNFTLEWKQPKAGYEYQEEGTETNRDKSPNYDVNPNKTSAVSSQPIPLNFYPYDSATLAYITFRVRGRSPDVKYTSGSNKGKVKTNMTMSDWSHATFYIYPPNAPTLTATPSESEDDVTTFSWSVSETENQPLVDVEYQTQLTAEGAYPDWNVPSSAMPASHTIPIKETVDVGSGSYTRWVRVRARGCGGASAWAVASRIYATPLAAQNVTGSAVVQSGGMSVTARWSQPTSGAYPVGTTEARYAIAVPTAGMKCPSGTSETVFSTLSGVGSSATGFIPETLKEDECLFVRIRSMYQGKDKSSDFALALAGKLKAPVISNVQTDNNTFRATITAENKSDVPDSFLVVQYRTKSKPSETLNLGIIEHGETAVTVQAPDWSKETAIEFGVYAVVGTKSKRTDSSGVTKYTISNKRMDSGDTVWKGGGVPKSPQNVTVTQAETKGTVQVSWEWSWTEADSAVISWADHEDAWNSTDEPEEYTISNIRPNSWNVSGLEVGKRWYFRVKLVKDGVSSAWSRMIEVDLGSAPSVPRLMLSKQNMTVNDSVTASWVYVSNDGTGQLKAKICEAKLGNSGVVYGNPFAETESEQHIEIYAKDRGWKTGETHYLSVQVWSVSGHRSEWSDLVPITVAEPITCNISGSSLVNETVDIDGISITRKALKMMPMTVKVNGAGKGNKTSLIIERAESFYIEQPDESEYNGHDKETIFITTQTGDAEITIDESALIGRLNDGAKYRIIATISDELGQSASDELLFTVNWTHKAIKPEGTVDFVDMTAEITPSMPTSGYEDGDTCDIYRLSADKPQLLVKAAEFGKTYIDPYPTLGENGGYRLVYLTSNNDYITADNIIAWEDYETELESNNSIINFGAESLELKYNLSLSSSWSKDFKETKYLGGSVVGDWNVGTTRKGSISGVMINIDDIEEVGKLRDLARHTGICHVRTPDGSNYSADVQVSENRGSNTAGKIVEFDLSVTRVDTEETDGMEKRI